MGRAEKEIANNHLRVNRMLYKYLGQSQSKGEDSFSLGQAVVTTSHAKPHGTALAVQLFSTNFGISVATAAAKWYRMWGSICSLCPEKCSYIELINGGNFASD